MSHTHYHLGIPVICSSVGGFELGSGRVRHQWLLSPLPPPPLQRKSHRIFTFCMDPLGSSGGSGPLDPPGQLRRWLYANIWKYDRIFCKNLHIAHFSVYNYQNRICENYAAYVKIRIYAAYFAYLPLTSAHISPNSAYFPTYFATKWLTHFKKNFCHKTVNPTSRQL